MNKEHYLSIVDGIIASKSFGRSDTYANMLKYLVTCSLEANIPKETTIASEIFGKERFDPSQSTLIRVYIYNLRKKLKKYYENEGINDEVFLEIPKGSYEVKFTKKVKEKKAIGLKKWHILLLLSFVIIPTIFINYKPNKISNTALWTNILKNDKSTMLVLGDLFIYNEKDSIKGGLKTIREPEINSIEEFETLVLPKHNKPTDVEPLTYAFLIRNSVTWVKDLSKVFFQVDKDFIIRTMSRFNPKELSDNNLIVVGMLKTLGIFKDYLGNEGFTLNKSELKYTDEKTNQTYKYTPKGNADEYHTDYAVILKVKGPNNNNIILFGGIWDTGASQSLKHFTDLKLAKDLENTMLEKFGKIPENYKILFEVSGVDRMELNSKILHLEEITKH
ncbi:hypothetical protein GCM10022291_17770 [Postechiella marina]|uniref:Helix-turn-helix domain-containing protein n=1 Tax=Postechiella marina TaxID=943941 RepID=A0ABP8C8G6_9FLAO